MIKELNSLLIHDLLNVGVLAIKIALVSFIRKQLWLDIKSFLYSNTTCTNRYSLTYNHSYYMEYVPSNKDGAKLLYEDFVNVMSQEFEVWWFLWAWETPYH